MAKAPGKAQDRNSVPVGYASTVSGELARQLSSREKLSSDNDALAHSTDLTTEITQLVVRNSNGGRAACPLTKEIAAREVKI